MLLEFGGAARAVGGACLREVEQVVEQRLLVAPREGLELVQHEDDGKAVVACVIRVSVSVSVLRVNKAAVACVKITGCEAVDGPRLFRFAA